MVVPYRQISSLNVENQELAWWIEVRTYQPACTYFFGPFESRNEAIWNQSGYLEDIQAEQPMGIMTNISQTQPEQLTIDESLT